MPQKGSTDLFHIIKSLDRTEKAYFKKFAERHVIGEQNNYVRLFDAIDKQAEYDEAKILKEEKYIKQLPYLKNYLFDLIMKSMNVYHADSSPESRVENEILRIRLLYKKGFFDLCHKLIARTKQECIKYEFFSDAAKLLAIESHIMSKSGSMRGSRKKYHALYQEKFRYEECSRVVSLYSNLQNDFFFKIWELQHNRKIIKARDFAPIMNHELLKNEKSATSLHAKVIFNNMHSLYNYYIDDLETHYYFASRHKELHQQTFFIFRDTLRYLVCLNNYYYACLYTQKYDICNQVLEEMKSLPVQTLRDEEEVFGRYLMLKSDLFVHTGEFKKGISFMKQYMPVYEKIKSIIKPNRNLNIMQNMARMHFSIGDYKESLKWTNLIISPESAKVDPEIYCHGLIANLMVHYELKNFELLSYLIKSAQRYFTANKLLKSFEKTMLHLFRELIKSNKNKKQLFEQTKNELEIIFQDSFYKNIKNYYDYIGWFESKIKK